MVLRMLTWNLMHGRAVPPAHRELFDEFAAALASWGWDVALLQEVPPWWPAAFGERLDAAHRLVLTSRNAGLPLRRAVATHRPDLIKSNGGGCNATLVRGAGIAEHRTLRLRRLPERRWLQAVRLEHGAWVGNLHATVHDDAAARAEAALAARTMLQWASGTPAVLGGDFNVRSLSLAGFEHAGGHDVDQVFARGFRSLSAPEVLDRELFSDHGDALAGRAQLSDHAPVVLTLGDSGS